MIAKEIRILEMCIDNGIDTGWNRAHKHNSDPDELSIKTCIYESIIAECYEWFKFEENGYES
jgi:hypothetical protein